MLDFRGDFFFNRMSAKKLDVLFEKPGLFVFFGPYPCLFCFVLFCFVLFCFVLFCLFVCLFVCLNLYSEVLASQPAGFPTSTR